jgi:hypothetical protein
LERLLERSRFKKMTTAEKKAHNDRAKMEAVIFTAQRELIQYCGQASPGVRNVERKLTALQSAWNSLVDAHVTYCAAASQDMGSGDSQSYMEEKQSIYFAGKMMAEKILYQNDDEAESDKTQLGVDLKKEISLMQLEITEEIKCLTKVVNAPTVTSEALKEAKEMREKLEEKLKIESKTLGVSVR